MSNTNLFWHMSTHQQYIKNIKLDFIQRSYSEIKRDEIRIPFFSDLTQDSNNAINVDNKNQTFIHALLTKPTRVLNLKKSAQSIEWDDISTFRQQHKLHTQREVYDLVFSTYDQKKEKHETVNAELTKLLDEIVNKSIMTASTMALICQKIGEHEGISSLSINKAFFIGLFSNIGIVIGLSCFVKYYLDGNYLSFSLLKPILYSINQDVSKFFFTHWGFDSDFISCFANTKPTNLVDQDISYFDLKKMASYLHTMRENTGLDDEHQLELTLAGAEAMFELSNLDEETFNRQLHSIRQFYN